MVSGLLREQPGPLDRCEGGRPSSGYPANSFSTAPQLSERWYESVRHEEYARERVTVYMNPLSYAKEGPSWVRKKLLVTKSQTWTKIKLFEDYPENFNPMEVVHFRWLEFYIILRKCPVKKNELIHLNHDSFPIHLNPHMRRLWSRLKLHCFLWYSLARKTSEYVTVDPIYLPHDPRREPSRFTTIR